MAVSPTLRFLKALFGAVPEGAQILVWTLRHKRSSWYTDLDKAAHRALVDAETDDVYVGVGWREKNLGTAKRGSEKDVYGIVGLWADIDVLSEAHKPTRRWFPEKKLARAWLESLPLVPSILLDSGHGLQAWWLFDEPWLFELDEDRKRAAEVSRRWTTQLRAWAVTADGDVDTSVADLPRILRVPGTLNHKSEPPAPVTALYINEKVRYGLDDFEPYLMTAAPVPVVDGGFELRGDANPPAEKLSALLSNDDDFAASWERSREDLADQSGSSYDLSLATKAAIVGWSPQEIVDLLIASRRKHDDDLKLRADYYERTIGKALASAKAPKVEHDAIEVLGLDDNDDRASTLAKISERLGVVKINDFVKIATDPPSYQLYVDGETEPIELGEYAKVKSYAFFGNAVGARIDRSLPDLKAKEWRGIFDTLLRLRRKIDPGEYGSSRSRFAQYLEQYLEERPPNGTDDWRHDALRHHPFKKDDIVHISTTGTAGLASWVKANVGDRVDSKDLARSLTDLGWVSVKVSIRTDDEVHNRGFWVRSNA